RQSSDTKTAARNRMRCIIRFAEVSHSQSRRESIFMSNRLLCLVVLLFARDALGQTAQLTQPAALHRTWRSSSAVIEHLPAAATVTASSHRGGYTHVRASDGQQGWVYSRYL